MFSITPSAIIEFLYCKRYTYYEHVLKISQHEEKYYKVMKGRNLHEEKTKLNKDYLRKKIGVTERYHEVWLADDFLRGIVDEVLILEDGTAAPLDYKYAEYKDVIHDTYRTQILCYAYLITKNFNRPVNKGYLVYTRSKNKLIELDLDTSALESLSKTIDEIYQIVSENIFPEVKENHKKCSVCTYRNICHF